MSEVLFYHLQAQPLEEVLPGLLERSLERTWRVVVESGVPERVKELDDLLWTFRDDSFLPHGAQGDGYEDAQPIYITSGPENPNGANVRFLVHNASLPDQIDYDRLVIMFNGDVDAEVQGARVHWKSLQGSEHEATYWQQNERGRWEKKA